MNEKHTVKVNCTNLGRSIEVPIGITLGEIAQNYNVKLLYSVVGATVNNKYVGLTYRVFQPKKVTFYDITHPEGMRTYIRSLILMLHVAVKEQLPGLEVSVLRSVSGGLYCELSNGSRHKPTRDELLKVRDFMHELQQRELDITRAEIETADAMRVVDHTPGTEKLLEQHGDIYTKVYSVAGHSVVLFGGDLVPNTRIVDVFDLVNYGEGFLLRIPQARDAYELAPLTTQDKMFSVFMEFDQWQDVIGAKHICDINEALSKGRSNEVIQIAEALHEKKVSVIADMIAERRDKVRVVLIAGPSSSGKTTFSKRLSVQLMVNGIRPVTLSTDDYFVNRENTPRDENGDYDFEDINAIDVKFFNQQLMQLINGEEVEIPRFDFTCGQRSFDGRKLRMEKNDVLIIEGTHGLTPVLTQLVPAEAKFKIYISPLAGLNFDSLTRINTTDNRLIRRIVRDYKYRGYSAEDTLARWASVRRGEDKYIYPNQEEADVMFNSALLYELSVLKVQAEPILLEVAPNSPQYSEARRLIHFLSYIKPIEMATIPPTSILREFLGGSSFEY